MSDSLAQFQAWRRRPAYKKLRSDPSSYLTTARKRLLQTLPTTHRLYSRANEEGRLKPERPPDLPRPPFTEEELKNIKARRRLVSDPDDVRYQLQDSMLVEMWNADYEREEQWREYDQAKPVMEVKREIANLPDRVFHPDDIVGEKRKRVVSAEYRPPVRRKVIHDYIEEENEFEEGEIRNDDNNKASEEARITEQSLQDLRERNEMLACANAALRAMAEGVTDAVPSSPMQPSFQLSQLISPPRSPPRSDQTDLSDCESDDSAKAVYGDDTEDLETDEAKPGSAVESWLNSVDHNTRKREDIAIVENKSPEQLGKDPG